MNGRIVGAVKTPWHLWLVGAVGLLWNAGGMFSWYSIMFGDPEAMQFTPEMMDFFNPYPWWALVTFTVGTWGAFFGCVALLFRSKLSTALFIIALLGLAGTTIYERVIATLPEAFQGAGQWIFAIVIWSTTIGLFLYARAMVSKGVLR